MHGVSLKKIKHMLDIYEHNITGQSLFAMLPPLECGRLQAQTSAVDAAQNQSKVPAVDNLSQFLLSPSTAGTGVASAHSCVVSSSWSSLPASGPHTVVSSADGGVNSCSLLDSSTSNPVAETVGSSRSDACVVVSCEMLTSPSSVCVENVSDSICCDRVTTTSRSASRAAENAGSADVLSPVYTESLSNTESLVLLAENAALASKHGVMATVTSLSTDADINCTDRKFTDNSTAASGTMCAEIMQTCGKLLTSEVSEAISVRSPDDEVADVVIDDAQYVSEVASSAGNTNTALCSCTEFEFETVLSALHADVHLGCCHPHAVDAADTQSSDQADLLLMPSVPEVANCSRVAGSATTESDDRGRRMLSDLSDAFCDTKSACGHVETVDGDFRTAGHSDMEHLKHVTLDETVEVECVPSHLANKKNDEKCPEFTLYIDADKKGAESEAYCIGRSIDEDRTTERLCETEKAPASFKEKLHHDVLGIVDRQTVVQGQGNDEFVGSEGKENRSVPAVAELMYWGQIDTGEKVKDFAHSSAEIHCGVVDTAACDLSVADSPAEQCVSGIEPKPQRTSVRSGPKKQVSSLMERIVAGKEWLSDCEPTTQSEHSSVDLAASCSDIDQRCAEQHSVSNEYQSNSTQTEPCDFVTLTKVTNGEQVLGTAKYVAVVESSPRVISSHVTDRPASPNIPDHLMLHKSCSTADETEDVMNSSQLELLTSCFPTISSRDLQELLTNCGNDVLIVADLLLEFGYEYNKPREDIADIPAPCSSSSSRSNSTRASPDRSVAAKSNSTSTKEMKSSKKNTLALCRLYRDSLMSKGIVAESLRTQHQYELQVPVNIPMSGL